MFKKPFSFKGRIRRLEYGLTFLICIIISFTLMMIIGSIPDDNKWLDRFIIIFLISAIVEIWFIIAQSAKRCHDLNKSGWYQLIPFYRLIILFLEGDVGENKYDRNPKDRHIFGSSEILDDDILLRHND